MSATSHESIMPRCNLRNGTILAVSQAAKLVNIPVAQDVVHNIRKMAIALMPSVLQVQKDNDTSAGELAACVKQLADTLDRASEYMNKAGFPRPDDGDEALASLFELQLLRDRLYQIHRELQVMQASQYSAKLTSRTFATAFSV